MIVTYLRYLWIRQNTVAWNLQCASYCLRAPWKALRSACGVAPAPCVFTFNNLSDSFFGWIACLIDDGVVTQLVRDNLLISCLSDCFNLGLSAVIELLQLAACICTVRNTNSAVPCTPPLYTPIFYTIPSSRRLPLVPVSLGITLIVIKSFFPLAVCKFSANGYLVPLPRVVFWVQTCACQLSPIAFHKMRGDKAFWLHCILVWFHPYQKTTYMPTGISTWCIMRPTKYPSCMLALLVLF